MSYNIKNFAQTKTYTVNDSTANTNAISLTLLGKSLPNYGTYFNQNFVWLLENFSNDSSNPPPYPVQGQLWWDSTYKFLNVYDNNSWKTVYGNLATLNVNGAVTFSSTISAASLTTTGGGLVNGYLNGAIGANIANSGIFTTATVNGTLSAAIMNGGIIGNNGATFTGATLSTSSTITAYGTISSPTINAQTIGNTGATLTGTLSTASQTNITKLGNLSSLSLDGQLIPSSNASINLGNATAYWSTVYGVNFVGTSTTAKYADLAEKYLTDSEYPVGTVVMVGGDAEVTQHDGRAVRAIGAVSQNPAYKMNGDLEGGTYIALKGRVPVRVIGPITKGHSLRGAPWGVAIAEEQSSPYTFAIALETVTDPIQTIIEAVIL
jgi:hypothetical protein